MGELGPMCACIISVANRSGGDVGIVVVGGGSGGETLSHTCALLLLLRIEVNEASDCRFVMEGCENCFSALFRNRRLTQRCLQPIANKLVDRHHYYCAQKDNRRT